MNNIKEKSPVGAERILLSLRNRSKRKEDLRGLIQDDVILKIFGKFKIFSSKKRLLFDYHFARFRIDKANSDTNEFVAFNRRESVD